WQIFFKLQLPNSMPLLISATKTSAGLAVIGAIVGEFFAGFNTRISGLGYVIMKWLEYKIDAMMAAVIAAALLGIAVFAVISFIESKVLARFGQVQSNVFQ
ncbi:MAG: NitT/TauT family transport system permease protein, partial [Pirellulaceae bacterium]